MKTKYTIGGIGFATKAEIRAHAQLIKDGATEFQPIEEPEKHEFLLDLLQYHHRAGEKIGVGVKHFFVGYNTSGDKEFNIKRIDDSDENFAPRKCVEKFNPFADLSEACRFAVKDQTDAFRERALGAEEAPTCPFRGTELNAGNAHVDHAAPNTFAKLFRDWMEENSWTVADITLADTGERKELEIQEQLTSWQEYHREHAELRLVSWEANLSECRTEAPTPEQ